MKINLHYYFLFVFLFSIQCKKSNVNQLDLLPPITSSGMNTFGCLFNGNSLIPKDGVSTLSNPYPYKGAGVVFNPYDLTDMNIYNTSPNSSSVSNFFIRFHFTKFHSLKLGDIQLEQSSFGTEAFPYYHNHIYGSFYDPIRQQFNWYGSYDSSGTISIIRFDTIQHIFSGIFSGKLREENGISEITITKGRFDINWSTIGQKIFP